MIERTTYEDKVNTLQTISTHYDNDAINKAVDAILNARDNYELMVLVVGHFNAGKSSLVNSFIGRDGFLAEDQGETTALAAELRYSEEEKAFSYDKDNNCEKIIEGKNYLPSEYDHLDFYLNSSGLKEIEDYVLVDTPGFDTAIEEHTQALLSYLKYGVGFVVVIDVEKGGLDSSTLSYLYEISKYSNHVIILLNKCDKQMPEQVEKVVSLIKVTLMQHGFDYPIYTISKFDEDIVQKIASAVQGINAQQEYDMVLLKAIMCNAKLVRDALVTVGENLFFDTYDLDECIRVQERNKELIQKRFCSKKEELLESIDNDVESILGSVRSVLNSQADAAATAIENGNTIGLQAIVTDAIRPVMVEKIKGFTTDKLIEIGQSVSCTVKTNTAEERGMDDIILSIGEKIQGIISSGLLKRENESSNSNEKTEKLLKSGSTNELYKMVTAAISLTTDAVAPWMEMVVILLPEIVAGFKNLFGESNHSKICRQYEAEVVPQVINALWPIVRESLMENVDTMITLFGAEMENNMDSIGQLIRDAQDKRATSQEEYQAFKQMIEKDIATINVLLEESR